MNSFHIRLWFLVCFTALLGCSDNSGGSKTAFADTDTTTDTRAVDSDQRADTTSADTSMVDSAIDTDGSELGDTEIVDATADLPDVDDVTPDLENEDIPEAEPMCLLSVVDESGAIAASCDIMPRTMRGCDDVARCVCQYYIDTYPEAADIPVDVCVQVLTRPLGMVTFADVCLFSGNLGPQSLSELVASISMPFGLATELRWWLDGGESLTTSPDCSDVAAFTLGGQEDVWNISLAQPEMMLFPGNFPIEDFPLETPPLLELDRDVEGLLVEESLLLLNAQGQTRLRLRIEGDTEALLGRDFLIHTSTRALFIGKLLNEEYPDIQRGIVLFLNEFEDDDFSQIRFWMDFPMSSPFTTNIFSTPFAARGLHLDAGCISTCGCPQGRTCETGRCAELQDGECRTDADCCFETCDEGVCR